VPWAFLEQALPLVDNVFHDLKLMDPARHRKWTGVDNGRILENFSRAYQTFSDKVFVARSPIIPGVNDSEDHVRSVLSFILPHKNVVRYELLPYHRLGEGKYGYLGKVYELRDFPTSDPKRIQELRTIVDEAFQRREK
jgi:pyruvate formate lyase activating enzyme